MTADSGKALFALWVAAIIAVTVALLILFGGFAGAAEMVTCKVYATRGSSIALRQLLGLPFIDTAAGRFLYRKAYTFCLLQDEVPEISFSPEEQPIVTGMPSPPTRPEPVLGSVPATDPADVPVAVPIAPAPKAKTKVKVTATTGTDQPLCASHNMRTVYSGKRWNCRK